MGSLDAGTCGFEFVFEFVLTYTIICWNPKMSCCFCFVACCRVCVCLLVGPFVCLGVCLLASELVVTVIVIVIVIVFAFVFVGYLFGCC